MNTERTIGIKGPTKKLSVAMCTYNGAAYLPAQLESIARQERPPDEVVIGDDSSVDDTRAIIERFAAQAPFPIHLHVNDRNIGSTQNFERTILRCEGEIIVLSDQDDVWFSSKLAKLEAVLDDRSDVGLVFSDAELVGEDLQQLGRRLWDVHFRPDEQAMFLKGQWLDVLFQRNVVTGHTMAFRSEFCHVLFPVPQLTVIIHDGWIALAIGACAKLAFIPEPLVLYRQHYGQQLGTALNTHKKHVRNVLYREDYAPVARYYEREIVRLRELCATLSTIRDRALAQSVGFALDDASWTSLQNKIQLAQDLIMHYHVRGQLSSKRSERVRPIAQELFGGRYGRYSRGALSALKDFVR